MTDRRRFLTTGLTAIAAGVSAAGFGRRASAAALPSWPAAAVPLPAALASTSAALARARPLSPGFHMVDGWILTDRDLEDLAHAV